MYIRSKERKKKSRISLQPDFIAKSVTEIDFAYLKKLGVTACFIDLDGTVVDRGRFDVTPQLQKKLATSGMNIKIATNRSKSKSLKELKEHLAATGVIHPHGLYGKPTKRYFNNALSDFKFKREEVVMIGDRYVQDIFGGNRAGIHTLLVLKLGKSKGMFDRIISAIEWHYTKRLIKKYKKI